MKKAIKILMNIFFAIYIPAMAFAQHQKPNVLVIITDQQNANMMSCAGSNWLKTPNLDKLAGKGMRFKKAYATNPVCSPSRFSILTGMYPSTINMRHNGSEINEEKSREIMGA